uniref:Roadblock/LAMTOR2 domain-containing protein n=1 Tax=candidate division WOR-3 bacterium TaxID=2052148 RepID=A0A7C3N965_UNCW3
MNEGMKVDRDSVSLIIMIAEDLFKNKALNESINYCKLILSEFPDIKDAKVLLYKSLKELNDPSSTDILNELLKEFPDDPLVKSLAEPVVSEISNKVEVKKDESNIEQKGEFQKIEKDNVITANETENLLDRSLEEINSINGVLGSIIIEESGLVIRAKILENLDPEITSALFSTIFSVSEDSISKTELGLIDRIFIEIGKVRIYLFKGNGYILGIFTEEVVKIGLILIKAKQLLKNIKQVLEQ